MTGAIAREDHDALVRLFGADWQQWPDALRVRIARERDAEKQSAEARLRIKREQRAEKARVDQMAAELERFKAEVAEVKAEHAEAVERQRRAWAAIPADEKPPEGWSMQVMASNGFDYYTVASRPDTVNGGTYMHCHCTGWAFQRGKGKDCKHVIQALAQWSRGRK